MRCEDASSSVPPHLGTSGSEHVGGRWGYAPPRQNPVTQNWPCAAGARAPPCFPTARRTPRCQRCTSDARTPCLARPLTEAEIKMVLDDIAPLHSLERRAVPPARWSCTRGDAARRAPVVAHPCSEVFGSLAEPQGLAVVTPQQSPRGSVYHPPVKWSMESCLALGSPFQAYIKLCMSKAMSVLEYRLCFPDNIAVTVNALGSRTRRAP